MNYKDIFMNKFRGNRDGMISQLIISLNSEHPEKSLGDLLLK